MLSNRYFTIENSTLREKWITISILFLIAFTGLFSIYFSPNEKLFHLLNIPTVNGCPLLTLTDIPCPFCGMGRSFSCLTDFKFARSFYYNPMGMIFFVLAGSAFGIILILSILNKKIVFNKPGKKLWYIPVLFVLITWILNILYGHHH